MYRGLKPWNWSRSIDRECQKPWRAHVTTYWVRSVHVTQTSNIAVHKSSFLRGCLPLVRKSENGGCRCILYYLGYTGSNPDAQLSRPFFLKAFCYPVVRISTSLCVECSGGWMVQFAPMCPRSFNSTCHTKPESVRYCTSRSKYKCRYICIPFLCGMFGETAFACGWK